MSIKSKKIRESARGEDCTVGVVGVCNRNPETTVLAHLQFDGGIMAGKADDLSACYACSDCHDFIDRRNGLVNHKEQDYRWLYMGRALARTIKRLHEKGVINV